jgi:hypothetical protein
MIALQYLDEIEKTDLKEIFEDEESHIVEINDGECGFSFGDDDEILRISTEIFNELNFYNVQYVQEYGKPTWYWCGILCEFPWEELNMEEETILNLIKKYHLCVIKKDDKIYIEFNNPTKSPLYKFFYKYRDGYGENIPHNINSIIHFFNKYLKAKLIKDPERYGNFYENEVMELEIA